MRSLVIALLALVAACAHDLHATFPARPEEPTSTLVLLLSEAAQGVSVAVNGVLLVEDAHTQRITIDHVPTGNVDVVIAANGADKAMRTWLDMEHTTTIPLGVPDAGGAIGIVKTIVGAIVTVAVYTIIHRY